MYIQAYDDVLSTNNKQMYEHNQFVILNLHEASMIPSKRKWNVSF